MPPKSLIWTGASNGTSSTPGTYAEKGNWIDKATGVSPTTSPTNTDHLTFDRGNISIADVVTGHTLGNIVVTEDYHGTIAPGGTFSANAASIRHAGGSANFTGNVANAKFSPRGGSMIIIGGGTWAKVFAQGTNMNILGSAVVTQIRLISTSLDDLFNAIPYSLIELDQNSRVHSLRGGKFDAHAGCAAEISVSGVLSTGTRIRTHGSIVYKSKSDIAGSVEIEPKGVLDARSNSTQFPFTGTLSIWPDAIYELETRAGPVVPSSIETYAMSASSNVGSGTPL